MRFKQDIPTYTGQFICEPNLQSMKSDAARTRKKVCKFTIHTANMVRIAIDAGNFYAPSHYFLHHIAYCQSNRLLILCERPETVIRF
jgi:hypothetical protein